VALGKLSNTYKSLGTHLQSYENGLLNYLIGLLRGLNDIMYAKYIKIGRIN
jgi:hypothetical protein